MISKRKLAIILPMLFEAALGWNDYYQRPSLDNRINEWGWSDSKYSDGMLKTGSIGGGYYGGKVGGLRPHEEGNAGNRTYGSQANYYPYAFEPERTLNKDSLEPLPIEARYRFLIEPFRNHILNMTGQLPTLSEVKKMRSEFKEFVTKELNLTNSQADKLFGTITKKGKAGVLPSYLLFDDMDKFDFDPEEALKYMPRISKNPTKSEIEDAYLKAWEILGKSDTRLKQVYDVYRRKYLEKNPLGPVMTEKEFLLFSIKLREREAAKLGFVSSYPDSQPILKNLEISIFLRQALEEEYENYKSQRDKEKSSSKNFVNEALFTDKLINDEVLPSPYDPIEGRFAADTLDDMSIINITEARENMNNGDDVYDQKGNLVIQMLDDKSDPQSPAGSKKGSFNGDFNNNNSDDDDGKSDDKESEPRNDNFASKGFLYSGLKPMVKYVYPKSSQQLKFESSIYSTSAQKRVIDKLDDYTLVDLSKLDQDKLIKLSKYIVSPFSSKADTEAQRNYYAQRIGEQGRDVGTDVTIISKRTEDIGQNLFFIPKSFNSVYDNKNNVIFPVPATGFEIQRIEDGKALVTHSGTNTTFNIDYSGNDDFYLKSYIGDLSTRNPVNNDLLSDLGWKFSESQIPSASRLMYNLDQIVLELQKSDKNLESLVENLRNNGDDELADNVVDIINRKNSLLKNYEHSRNEYLKRQDNLLENMNQRKLALRFMVIRKMLHRMNNSLTDPSYKNVDFVEILNDLTPKQVATIKDKYDQFSSLFKDLRENFPPSDQVLDDDKKSFNEYLDNCQELANESSKINLEIVESDNDILESYRPVLDLQNKKITKLLDLIQKIELVHDAQVRSSELISENFDDTYKRYTRKKVPEPVLKDLKDILTENVDLSHYRIRFNSAKKHDYYIDGSLAYPKIPSISSYATKGRVTTVSRGTSTSKDVSDQEISKRRDRVKIVFEESVIIIEEFIRKIFESTSSRKERMEKLLELESELIKELSIHRLSLETVLGRPITFEDEFATEKESSELLIRLKLKIYEARIKLLSIADAIDKLYFYPSFLRPDSVEFKRIKKIEEESFKYKYGYSYLPKFRYDENGKYIVGIDGFEKINGPDFRNRLFERSLYGYKYQMESWKLDSEILSIISTNKAPELEEFFISPLYAEMSLFSRRIKLIKLLRSLLKVEKDKHLRAGLKRLYFRLKKWQDKIKRIENLSESEISEATSSSNFSEEISSKVTGRLPSRIRRRV